MKTIEITPEALRDLADNGDAIVYDTMGEQVELFLDIDETEEMKETSAYLTYSLMTTF